MSRPKVIFFDVNGTLLDIAAMQPSIAQALGGRKDLFPLWMSTLLHTSLVDSATGSFHEFSEIAAAALRLVAAKNGMEIKPEDARAAVAPMRSLPPFPDVARGLEALHKQGHVLAALTNSARAACSAQLEHAGIAACFQRQLTVDVILLYKPHPEVYRWACSQMDIATQDGLMVAAHGWDLAGAKAAGMQTAFLQRPGQSLHPLAPPPDIIAANIPELEARLAPGVAA